MRQASPQPTAQVNAVLGGRTVIARIFGGALITGFAYSIYATIIVSKPIYPEAALRQCVEGFVVLSFEVIEKGNLGKVSVIESDPSGVFDQASISALQDMARTEEFMDLYPHRGPWNRRFSFELASGCTHRQPSGF